MLVLKIILSLSGAFNCIHYNIFLEKIIWQISSILVHPMPLFPWLYYRMVFSFNTCWVDILVPQRKLAYTCPCLCIKKIQVDCNIVGKFAGSLNIPSWSFFKAYFFRHSCEPCSLRSKRQVQYQRRCALCCAFHLKQGAVGCLLCVFSSLIILTVFYLLLYVISTIMIWSSFL